jgi:hypothetical protein
MTGHWIRPVARVQAANTPAITASRPSGAVRKPIIRLAMMLSFLAFALLISIVLHLDWLVSLVLRL